MTALYIILIFALIIAAGAALHKKRVDFWPSPVWIMRNISSGFAALMKALACYPVPRSIPVIGDRNYFSPPQAVVDHAVSVLAGRMKEQGWVKANYIPEKRDCDNAALFQYDELVNDILPDLTAEYPAAASAQMNCGMWSFVRDNGKRHRVAWIENNRGVRTYVDTYEINGTIIRELSESEKINGFDIV